MNLYQRVEALEAERRARYNGDFWPDKTGWGVEEVREHFHKLCAGRRKWGNDTHPLEISFKQPLVELGIAEQTIEGAWQTFCQNSRMGVAMWQSLHKVKK